MPERKSLWRGVKGWAAGALVLWAANALAAPVADDRGVVVDLPKPPQRIVTLLPSLTEAVCDLGACARLVGVDSYSNWPAEVAKLPRIGGVADVNIELVVSLRPDVVLLSATSRALPRLEALGVKVFGIELKTMADLRRTLDKLDQVLQVQDAGRAWDRLDAGIAAAARGVDPAARGATVYFEVATGPYAASESSHVGELLARLGAANVVPGSLGSVPKLNPEFVVRADPQVIIVSERSARQLKERPGWSRIRAVRDGRVCALTAAQGDVVSRPGPRLAEAARVLADCLSPGRRSP